MQKGHCAHGVGSGGRNCGPQQGGTRTALQAQPTRNSTVSSCSNTSVIIGRSGLFQPVIMVRDRCAVFMNLFNSWSNPTRQDFTAENSEGQSGEVSCLSHEAGPGSPSVGSGHLSRPGHLQEGLLKHTSPGPTPRASESLDLGGAPVFTFVTNFQVLWKLVMGAPFENPCSKL